MAIRSTVGQIKAADHALFRRATRSPAPRIDAVLYPLSDLAAKARLWIAIAAVLGLSGGRTGRRAALRGLVSISGAPILANVILKPLARRRRPTPIVDLWLTRPAPLPRTTSFPSGHSASAAAFATGVALESPVVGVPLAAAALAVGWSRIRTRVHYPTDVVVGLAVGAGVAVSTMCLWPVVPRTPATAPIVRRRSDRRADPAGGALSIVANPSAGGRTPDILSSIRRELPDATVLEIDDGDALIGALTRAATTGAAIGVVGGDGSINAAAGIALERDLPLAVFAGGTLNHFARDTGLTDPDVTIAAIRSGDMIHIDVGLIDGKPFLNTASLGSYAELVDARERLEDRMGKWPAMAVAAGRVLWSAEPTGVIIDGSPCRVWLMFIGNCEYQPAGLAPGWRNQLDDGQFDVRYVDANVRWSRTRLVAALLTGQLGRTRVYQRSVVSSLLIESTGASLRLARDGETFDGSAVVEVTKHPIGLDVYAAMGT